MDEVKCWCGSDTFYDDEGTLFCSSSMFHDPLTVEVQLPEPKVLYLSGPMTGYPDCNYPAFNQMAARLREHGFTVHNPAEVGDKGSQYVDLLKKDIRLILESEGVAVMEKWWESKGARLEVNVAAHLDLPIRPVDAWIARRPK